MRAAPRIEHRGSLLYPALLSLGAGVLASCTPVQAPPLQTSAVRPLPPSPEASERPRHPPRPPRKPAPPAPLESAASAGGEESLAMTAPKPPAASAPAPISPPPPDSPPLSAPPGSPPLRTSELIGLDQPAAAHLFGPAAERSERPPATVWRYRNGVCELDLFFYLDLRSGRMRTLHYALRGSGGDVASQQDCLRSLLVSRGS